MEIITGLITVGLALAALLVEGSSSYFAWALAVLAFAIGASVFLHMRRSPAIGLALLWLCALLMTLGVVLTVFSVGAVFSLSALSGLLAAGSATLVTRRSSHPT